MFEISPDLDLFMYLAPEWRLRQKSYVWSIREKAVREIENILVDNYFEYVYELSSDKTCPLPTSVGVKHMRNGDTLDFPISSDKTLLWSCLDQQLPAAKLFMRMSWGQLRKQNTKGRDIRFP